MLNKQPDKDHHKNNQKKKNQRLFGDATTGRFKMHKGVIDHIQFSKDGKFFSTVSHLDQKILVHSCENAEILQEIDMNLPGFLCVEFTKDGEFLAVSFYDKSIKLYKIVVGNVIEAKNFSKLKKSINVVVQKPMLELRGILTGEHEEMASTMCFNENNSLLVSGGNDNKIVLWDIKIPVKQGFVQNQDRNSQLKLIPRQVISHFQSVIDKVTICPKGVFLAAATGYYIQMSIQQLMDFEPFNKSKNQRDFKKKNKQNQEFYEIDDNQQENVVLTVEEKIILQKKKQMKKVANQKPKNQESDQEDLDLVSIFIPEIHIYSLTGHNVSEQDLNRKLIFQKHKKKITCLQFSPYNSKFLASAGEDSLICLWDPKNGKNYWDTGEAHQKKVKQISFSQSCNRFIYSIGCDQYLKAWDIQSGNSVFFSHPQQFDELSSFAINCKDNGYIVIASLDGYFQVIQDEESIRKAKMELKRKEDNFQSKESEESDEELDQEEIINKIDEDNKKIWDDLIITEELKALAEPQKNNSTTVFRNSQLYLDKNQSQNDEVLDMKESQENFKTYGNFERTGQYLAQNIGDYESDYGSEQLDGSHDFNLRNSGQDFGRYEDDNDGQLSININNQIPQDQVIESENLNMDSMAQSSSQVGIKVSGSVINSEMDYGGQDEENEQQLLNENIQRKFINKKQNLQDTENLENFKQKNQTQSKSQNLEEVIVNDSILSQVEKKVPIDKKGDYKQNLVDLNVFQEQQYIFTQQLLKQGQEQQIFREQMKYKIDRGYFIEKKQKKKQQEEQISNTIRACIQGPDFENVEQTILSIYWICIFFIFFVIKLGFAGSSQEFFKGDMQVLVFEYDKNEIYEQQQDESVLASEQQYLFFLISLGLLLLLIFINLLLQVSFYFSELREYKLYIWTLKFQIFKIFSFIILIVCVLFFILGNGYLTLLERPFACSDIEGKNVILTDENGNWLNEINEGEHCSSFYIQNLLAYILVLGIILAIFIFYTVSQTKKLDTNQGIFQNYFDEKQIRQKRKIIQQNYMYFQNERDQLCGWLKSIQLLHFYKRFEEQDLNLTSLVFIQKNEDLLERMFEKLKIYKKTDRLKIQESLQDEEIFEKFEVDSELYQIEQKHEQALNKYYQEIEEMKKTAEYEVIKKEILREKREQGFKRNIMTAQDDQQALIRYKRKLKQKKRNPQSTQQQQQQPSNSLRTGKQGIKQKKKINQISNFDDSKLKFGTNIQSNK